MRASSEMAVCGTCLVPSLCIIASTLLQVATTHAVDTGDELSPLQKLRRDLLVNYDKYARPVVHHNNITNVTFGISPLYVSNLDEEKQVLTLETWLHFYWNDHHLSWEPEKYSGIQAIHFASHEVWQPDISVYSSMPVSQIDPRMDTYVIGYSNGQEIWVPPATINSYCEINYVDYPYDTQECNISFGSWTHHGESINVELNNEPVSLSDFRNTNPRWELTDMTAYRFVKYYNCCSEPYVTIVATAHLRRRQPSLPQHVLWGPSLVAILFTLAMFWLPSNSVQKVILGCTSLTILTVLLLYIGETVPSSIAAIMSASELHSLMYIVGSATLMQIIIINLGRIAGWWRLPAVIPHVLQGIVGRILLICPSRRRFGLIEKMETETEDGEESVPRDSAEEWFLLSTALDRICFVIYLLIFIIHRNI